MRLIVLLTLTACAQPGPVASETPYGVDVDRVRAAWSLDESLPADRCDEPAVRLEAAWPDCDGGYCVLSRFIRGSYRARHMLEIRAGLDDATTRALVRHEAAHWLSVCTDHEATQDATGYPYGNADYSHRDARLWGPDGVVARAGAM